jgi:hypothetical protein
MTAENQTSGSAEGSQSTTESAADQQGKPKRKRKSPEAIIVEAVRDKKRDHELWHTDDDSCFMSLHNENGTVKHLPLKAKSTWQYFAALYRYMTSKIASSQTLTNVITTLEGYAMAGPKYPVFVRVARYNDAIYIDLGDDTWEAIEVTASGYSIILNPPVRFKRPKGLLPLPYPEKGGSLDDLRPLLNANNPETWLLVKAWLIGALNPRGPYAILVLNGEQGSTKTSTQRKLRSVIDPNKLAVRRSP